MTECENKCRYDNLRNEIDRKLTYWKMIRDHDVESGNTDHTSQVVYSEMCDLWLVAHNVEQTNIDDFSEESE